MIIGTEFDIRAAKVGWLVLLCHQVSGITDMKVYYNEGMDEYATETAVRILIENEINTR